MDDRIDGRIGTDLERAGLLSNGAYSVLLLEDGTGYSSFDGYALTPWRDDHRTAGLHLYVQDGESGALWSAGFEPARAHPTEYEARLAPGSVQFRRLDGEIETTAEICVVPDRGAEMRIYRIANRSDRVRSLTLTSYCEVALNSRNADAGHPAFSKLFVQTEIAEEIDGLIARRRPRALDETPPILAHAFVSPVGKPDAFETDRVAFIGRGRTLADPRGLETGLSGTVGNVLDPILSLQREVTLDPGESAEFVLVLSAGYSRDEVIESVRALRSESVRTDALLQATLREQRIRDELKIGPRNADRYHRLAAGVVRGLPQLGPSSDLERKSGGSSQVERKLGLDPSLPLLVGRIADSSELHTARLLLKARDFWRALGLRTQVLLLNDMPGERAGKLERELRRAIVESSGGRPDVVLWHADALTADEQLAVQASARLWITADRARLLRVARDEAFDEETPIHFPNMNEPGGSGALETLDIPAGGEQIMAEEPPAGEELPAGGVYQEPVTFAEDLQFFNGIGGFSADGREYVIQLRAEGARLKLPPKPWVNVIANETAGCVVSETGAGFTWTENSREHRLTPWFNDPLLDPHGEALYFRDVESGALWCPTPGPIQDGVPVEVRHGFGFTRFMKRCHGLHLETVYFVPHSDPIKMVRVRITNESGRKRRLGAAAYAAWVLGSSLEDRRFIVTEYDDISGCIVARNPHNEFAGDAPAFAALIVPDGDRATYTASRESFVGTLGDAAHPVSLLENRDLDRRSGAGLDPCAAFLKEFDLDPGEAADVVFILGQTEDVDRLPDLVDHYSERGHVDGALDGARKYWEHLTSAVHVETPSREIDLMLNGWLVYQNVSSRIRGRTGSYQSGGAFGFRDQLQDAGAMAGVCPEITRKQIILHASHQFEDGDVLHWWHPPTGRGIRTHFSDDLLWLPYVALYYVETTGDSAIWDEEAGYVSGPEVPEGADEIMMDPERSQLVESVFRHCCRALDRSRRRGSHGLPLMGSGDWNDGMNRVGREGYGESVWLGFFLYDILTRFARVCSGRGEAERAERYRTEAAALKEAVNDAGWDGAWYRRAYFDDGEPLGSISNDECRIDALAQAWAVLSGAAPNERAAMALDAVEQHLISEEDGIIRLLTPPFENSKHDPGYIRGYLSGVRENGGQYTHAALWVVSAMAAAGRCEQAAGLLEMLSPVSHGRTEEEIHRYEVEPYVVAADVYGSPPHVGQGGWTWYTGSAGWMYRVGLESILGIRLVDGNHLEIAPCIPSSWPEYRVRFRHPEHGTTYHIHVLKTQGSSDRTIEAVVDGEPVGIGEPIRIPLKNDGARHEVEISRR